MKPAAFHIAVFARAPVPGAAKTRLIPLLGAEGAATAHSGMALRALATARAAANGNVSLWTAGDPAHAFFKTCRERFGLALEPQQGGTLGERMAHCLQTLLQHHGTVLLIGTDCPVLSASDLRDAAAVLQQGAKMVFTPADDGGYVLVGARQDIASAVLRHAFSAIDWGTGQVMIQTRQRLAESGQAGDTFHEMPMRWDVDEPEDYLRAKAAGLLEDPFMPHTGAVPASW